MVYWVRSTLLAGPLQVRNDRREDGLHVKARTVASRRRPWPRAPPAGRLNGFQLGAALSGCTCLYKNPNEAETQRRGVRFQAGVDGTLSATHLRSTGSAAEARSTLPTLPSSIALAE